MASRFAKTLDRNQLPFNRREITTLQVNIGYRCNQACHHCHVESSPIRTENMDKTTVTRLVEVIGSTTSLKLVDITGGAPELNPHFFYLVKEVRKQNLSVIDRCNLTILFEPGQELTAKHLAENQVQIVASLPCYSKKNVDQQRGKGVFDKSIEALKILNNLGYGKEGTGLDLTLVYNPIGAYLPPAQGKLELDFKRELKELFNIEFNSLITITNMPIKRFHEYLVRKGELETYMQLLIDNFNPKAVENVMCRDLVSIGYDGKIYDCDFNQMLGIDAGWKASTIWDIENLNELRARPIAVDDHCFGCTAGAGSSCSGALT